MASSDLRLLAQEIASEIREIHEIHILPVPVKRIASQEGLQSRESHLAPTGYLVKRNGHPEIVYNSDRHPYGQRFTIAHELGHAILLGMAGQHVVRKSLAQVHLSTRSKEDFCNKFAASLLIPAAAVPEILSWESVNLDRIEAAARDLEVSPRCLAWYAIDNLPQDGGLLIFRYGGKPNDPDDLRFRIEWGAFPKSEHKPYVPKYKTVADTSLIGRAYQTEEEVFTSLDDLGLDCIREKTAIRAKRIGNEIFALVFPCTALSRFTQPPLPSPLEFGEHQRRKMRRIAQPS